MEDGNFDIVAPFVLIPCTRRLITQYCWFQPVVQCNMYSCAGHGAHSYVPSVVTVTETYTAARIWKCTMIGRYETEDSRRISRV